MKLAEIATPTPATEQRLAALESHTITTNDYLATLASNQEVYALALADLQGVVAGLMEKVEATQYLLDQYLQARSESLIPTGN